MPPDPSDYSPDYIAALRSLDEATMVAYLRTKRSYVPDPIGIEFWRQIHRSRMRCTALTEEERALSRQFLLDSFTADEH